MSSEEAGEIERLERAMAALEAQRAALGDAVVDAGLAPMCARLAALRTLTAATEQRKQVTVLFADVFGFTALSETMDAEDVTALMNALWERLDGVIVAHGGVIDKHTGDAVMALWGAETAREDDPEQAIRAALSILQPPPANFQFPTSNLQIRIGIHTGPVFLGEIGTRREFTAMGDTVNLANRLQNAAPVGGILISHDTYRHVRGVFEVTPQQPLTVKGKREPIRTYVVHRARPRAFRLPTRGVEGIETRMVGREGELGALQEGFRAVVGGRGLRALTVVGEAGIGKSRLLYEFQNWVDLQPEAPWLFQGRATEGTTRLPYGLLRDLFAFRFEIRDGDPPAVAREKLERGVGQFMPLDPNAVQKAHFIGHLIGLDLSESPHLRGILDDPRQIHARALHSLVQFFAAVTASDPALLLLEDLHWADDGSLDAIAHLIGEGRGLPLLIIALARPTLYERRPQWGAPPGVGQADSLSHTRLDLGPLSAPDSHALVAEVLQRVPQVPPALVELVVSSAEGNPFYVEELIKMLIDEGVILTGADEWQVDGTRLGAVHVPPTLTGVLQARLDGLPPVERRALQRASVVGRVFWDDAVRALSAAQKPDGEALDGVRATLRALRARELVFGRATSAFVGTQEFIFKHALLREVTYETVLKRLRRTYHALAAAWLVARSGERADEYAGLVAEHHEHAGDVAQAAEWYARAGRQAAETYALEAAIGYYRKAIALAQSRPGAEAQQSTWYEKLGEALRMRARYDEAAEAYAAMRAAAAAAGDAIAQARAWSELAWVQTLRGDHRASLESAQQAERLAADAGPAGRAALALALFRRAWAMYRLGDAAGALPLDERALALSAELGGVAWRTQALSLILLAALHATMGRFEQSEQACEQALALNRAWGDRRGVGVMLGNLGQSAIQRGDYAAAAARSLEALAVAREMGDRDSETAYLTNLGAARVGLGEYAAAEADLRRILEMMGAAHWGKLSLACTLLSEACLGQGKVAEALETARRALAAGQETGEREFIAWAWRSLGNCCSRIATGPPEADFPLEGVLDAPACYAESLRIFAEIGSQAERARTLRNWARYELAGGDRERGRMMWQEARATFEQLHMPLEVARMDAEVGGSANGNE